MIFLQTHSQILYQLNQITSVITSRPTSFAVHIKRCNNSGQKQTEYLPCKDNLSTDAWKLLESSGNNLEFLKTNRNWNISCNGGTKFSHNKVDLPLKVMDSYTSLIFHTSSKRQYKFVNNIYSLKICPHIMQVKYFKTNRSIETEFYRNPSVIARIKKWFGLNTVQHNKLDKFSNNVLATNEFTKEYTNLDKLRSLLDDKYITKSELQRIKAAFAEGYLAGHDRKPHGRTFKLFKIAQQIFLTLLLIIVIAAAMATTGGSMFKIQLGHKIQVDPEEIHVTFNDVKGVEEAKSELMDVVEFLKNPDKFSVLGGKLPKGVLLVGPPGTGKTLLARAVAGEAGVPFFHAAGPEFDEVLVGQGARRVRDLFKAAKERAPCVIFIDEIDSIGAKRINSALHPYANQTINQLLSEMDGFHQNEGVIVLGATNRHQDLDKALLRPGRFDLEITVYAPDFAGRKEIIDLYLGRILTHNIDSEVLAKRTVGFTGADIENMINQAALRAAIEGADYVTMDHLERARDKVIMGPEGKKKMLDEEDRNITAYHESGHALVTYYTKESVPLHKVTIIPRGQSLGHTSYLPHKDKLHMTKAQMLASIDSCMGGRAAEELIFGQDKVTSGASSDFLDATRIAEDMVKIYGMSEKVGFRVHKDAGRDGHVSYSTGTKELIDNEVKRLLQESYERAKTILKGHSKELKQLAEALLKHETLNADDVKTIINGKKLKNESNEMNRTIMDVPKKRDVIF